MNTPNDPGSMPVCPEDGGASFDVFWDACEPALKFLVEERAFAPPQRQADGLEAEFVCEGPAAGVRVTYEFGHQPTLFLVPKTDQGFVWADGYALEYLLLEQGASEAFARLSPPLTAEQVRQSVTTAAALLRRHGGDALRGEPALFARLKEWRYRKPQL